MATAPALSLSQPLRPATDPAAPRGADPGATERRRQEAAWVAQALQGDEEAFRRLVERYQRQVYWVAHDVLLDADEARDVAQETFLRVHGALDRFDPRRDFLNWIYRIARNLAIDAHRRRRRRPAPVDDLTAVPQRDEGPEDADETLRGRVNLVLAQLPVEYRLALTLREVHGLSPLEIARITDCTYPTARWRLHRARGLFRKQWEARYGAVPPGGLAAGPGGASQERTPPRSDGALDSAPETWSPDAR